MGISEYKREGRLVERILMGDYKFRFRDERKPVSEYRLESD